MQEMGVEDAANAERDTTTRSVTSRALVPGVAPARERESRATVLHMARLPHTEEKSSQQVSSFLCPRRP